MKTTEDCLNALIAGHTLVNVTGGRVWLDKFGMQCAEGMGKRRNGKLYSFSNPDMWQIEVKDSEHMLWWRPLILILIAFSLMLNYKLYKEAQEVHIVQPQSATKLLENYNISQDKLKDYQATEQWLMELGASSEDARETIKAAEAYRLSPKSSGH
jgi:hypothetical protein